MGNLRITSCCKIQTGLLILDFIIDRDTAGDSLLLPSYLFDAKHKFVYVYEDMFW